jgi:chemotaxis protein methyltransferase CheR
MQHNHSGMWDREFTRFSSFIYEQVGIKLPPSKKTMLEGRLHRRLKSLNIKTYEEYADYVLSSENKHVELIHLIDAVTTNKTDFFREPHHFEYLVNNVLPAIGTRGASSTFNIWSAGCSSGEEPYTMAMVLADKLPSYPGMRVSILASDICMDVLTKARNGIYPEERISTIPLYYKKKFLLKSREKAQSLVRIVPQLRALVTFRRLNFMDEDFGLKEKMDVIFCRNVVIYFDRPTQRNLMLKFHNQLKPGGYLFIGHSESLNGLDLPFTPVANTVFQKQ